MHGFVANTDYDWFTYLRAIEPPIDEVDFWKPGSGTNFSALQPGEPCDCGAFHLNLKSK